MADTKVKLDVSIPEKLPFLEAICWQTENVYRFTPEQMLSRYERGWNYRKLFANLETEELNFLKALARNYQSWLQAEFMNFKLDYHNKILTLLQSLDADLLRESLAYFGGGTLLALDLGEYRWSKDVDFICVIASSGYRQLRTVIFEEGYKALFRDKERVKIGNCTMDQYAIRMLVNVDREAIKMEIIAESRFELEPPRYPSWSSVACLSLNDCFTAKLLANSDRFMDDSVESRDLIDLAMLRLEMPIPIAAIAKAEKAYEVMRPLRVAVQRFQEREDYRERCFTNLRIDNAQIPLVIDGIDLLAFDFNFDSTKRSFNERYNEFY